jgi:sodium-dependent dicarboxylate transporter 2/3/5
MTAHRRWIGLTLGTVIALIAYAGCRFWIGYGDDAAITAAVTALCATWWCTEPIPIPITSLIPFVAFPCAGILDYGQLALAYGDKFVLLFMAGFMISRAAERSCTHLRISHAILRGVGTSSDRRLVIGFLLATALSSMWISNTATALIMLPVAIAIIEERNEPRLSLPLLLAVAYGSSIGGMATLIGTPPNGIMAGVYEQQTETTISFIGWMRIGIPTAVLMLIAAAVVLTWRLAPGGNIIIRDLGAWTKAQRRVLIIIIGTAFLWCTRTAPFGGWSNLFGMPKTDDATVGLAAVILMFLVPSGEKRPDGSPDTLLDWNTARDIPWGILLLFGGGLAIAQAFDVSHLADDIGRAIGQLNTLPIVLLIACICAGMTFMTEITSNTATTTLMMPILAAAARSTGVDPLLFMAPAALSASCAFMLPVATPPNAIVFGAERFTIAQMARTGVVLNLIGTVIITACCVLII